MAISKNNTNPVPFYESTNDWYDNRRSYSGIHSHVFAPKGYILPFQLTMPTIAEMSMTFAFAETQSFNGGNYTSVSGFADDEKTFTKSAPYAASIAIKGNGNGKCTIEGDIHLAGVLGAVHILATTYDLGSTTYEMVLKRYLETNVSGLATDTSHTFYLYKYNTSTQLYDKVDVMTCTGSLIYSRVTYTTKLVSAQSGTETDISSDMAYYPENVPAQYATPKRKSFVFAGGITLSDTTLPVGDYYLKLTIDNVVYVSEIFTWMYDVSSMLHIIYRRTKPIVTEDNFLAFTANGQDRYMEVYLDTEVNDPEYHDEEEQLTADGYVFIQKIVSWFQHTIEYPKCTEIMANTLRIVRHCNDISIAYGGATRPVEYIAAPEFTWEMSHHFCTAKMSFRTDTIVQTDGESENYILGNTSGSFDQSYDQSFN